MVNELSLLKGTGYKINDKIIVKHPTLNEIFEYGEENYFRAVNLFCLKPYDLMVQLDDMGVDYCTVDNYQLFLMLYSVDNYQNDIEWLIGKYDFQKYVNQQNDEIVLYDSTQNIIIDRLSYMQISDFLKKINYVPDRNEFNPANKMARKMVLNDKRRELQKLQKNDNQFESVLGNLISALVWNPNSKETIHTVWDLHIYQFYNGLRRIQKVNEYNNTMRGLYAGTIDQTKINLSNIDWTAKLTI